jgi:plastocyanin
MKRLVLGLAASVALLAVPAAVKAERYVIVVALNSFTPADLSALTGDQIVWTFTGPFSHTVTEDSTPPLFDSGLHSQPFRFRRVFVNPGDYFYHCQVHGGPGGIGQSGVVRISTRHIDDDDSEERP